MTDLIKWIISEREMSKRPPYHALYSDLLRAGFAKGMSRETINKELRELTDSGKIVVGHTINDVWIKIVG